MSRKNNAGPRLFESRDVFGSSPFNIVHKIYTGESVSHWHDFYELEIICAGEGAYEVNGARTEVTRSCAYLVTPEDYHKLTAKDADMYTLSFSGAAVNWELIRRISESKKGPVVRFSKEDFERIERILALLKTEFGSDMPMRELSIKNLFEYILICFLRSPEISESGRGDLSTAVMKAVSYIQNNFKRDLRLGEVAETASISPSHLGVLLKKEMNITFCRYLTLTRLKYARNLLSDRHYTLEDIAYASGFSSPSYFSGVFKKELGCSPSEMRKQMFGKQE